MDGTEPTPRVAEVQSTALRRAAAFSGAASTAVVIAAVSRLPLWVLIPAISLSVGGGPLVAWISGKRLARDLPPSERAAALEGLDRTLKGSATISSIRGWWLLKRVLLGTLIVIVCAVVLALWG
jgi:hypothetical protein